MIEIRPVDYNNSKQAQQLVDLLSAYALDEMGGGKALPDDVLSNLPAALSKLTTAYSFIAYVENKAVGLINCFEGFSTFKCQPLINVHDIVVLREYRGKGICQGLLNAVEKLAKEKGCAKLTLEVLEGNVTAQQSYRRFGFSGYELDPKMGKALFWEKPLQD